MKDNSPSPFINANCDTWTRCRRYLTFEDFAAIAPRLAEEICGFGYGIMKRKDFSNFSSPEFLYYQRYMRKEVAMCHETRTYLAIFLKRLFWEFFTTGKTTDFDVRAIISVILYDTGWRQHTDPNGYFTYGPTLENVCELAAEKFPSFIKTLERRLPYVGF